MNVDRSARRDSNSRMSIGLAMFVRIEWTAFYPAWAQKDMRNGWLFALLAQHRDALPLRAYRRLAALRAAWRPPPAPNDKPRMTACDIRPPRLGMTDFLTTPPRVLRKIARMKKALFMIVLLVLLPCTSPTTDESVAALIEKMLNKNTEQQAFAELEALGCPAVPAIVKRMDDRRNLPDPRISLRNKSPQRFEGLRHYAPQTIVDALAAILNQITGQHFGFIYNGASNAERAKTVRGWRDFVRSTPADKLCTGG
jgi:hypothetical protein